MPTEHQGLAPRSLWGTGREAPKAKLPMEPGFTLSLREREADVLRGHSQAEPSAEPPAVCAREGSRPPFSLVGSWWCTATVAPRGDVFRTAATRSRAAALLLWGVLTLGAAAAWGTGRGGGRGGRAREGGAPTVRSWRCKAALMLSLPLLSLFLVPTERCHHPLPPKARLHPCHFCRWSGKSRPARGLHCQPQPLTAAPAAAR